MTTTGAVFDTGALIAVERGDRAMAVLLAESRRTGAPIAVPAGCVAQVWRHPARQARTAVLLRQPHVEIVPLDDADARSAGLLLAATATTDVVDAHVALCAHRTGRPVLTSDPDGIRRLAPAVRINHV
jgi:predicted nucleic acid-binding protein